MTRRTAPGRTARLLLLTLSLLLAACGASGEQAADQYVDAHEAFRITVNREAEAITAEATIDEHRAAGSAIAAAAASFVEDVRAIDFPDAAKDEADAVIRAAVVFQQRSVAVSNEDEVSLVMVETLWGESYQELADAIALLRDALGLPPPT